MKPRPRAAETWVASQTSSPRTGSRFDRRANRSMIPAICLDPLYPGLLTEEKIPRIAAAGFRHIEFWGWRDKHILAIQAACRNHDVQIVNFSGHRTGSPIAEKTHPVLFADLSGAVPTARTLGCQTLMLLTNALNPDGSVADRSKKSPSERRIRFFAGGHPQILGGERGSLTNRADVRLRCHCSKAKPLQMSFCVFLPGPRAAHRITLTPRR